MGFPFPPTVLQGRNSGRLSSVWGSDGKASATNMPTYTPSHRQEPLGLMFTCRLIIKWCVMELLFFSYKAIPDRYCVWSKNVGEAQQWDRILEVLFRTVQKRAFLMTSSYQKTLSHLHPIYSDSNYTTLMLSLYVTPAPSVTTGVTYVTRPLVSQQGWHMSHPAPGVTTGVTHALSSPTFVLLSICTTLECQEPKHSPQESTC